MTLRRHAITGEPILFAPERAERPHAFLDDRSEERCPFCPGHEDDTPPPLAQIGDPVWCVRVVPNKYPPIAGAEVIIESPEHDDSFDTIAHAGDAVRAYVDRYRAHGDAAHVAIFKNHGPDAGASIPHVHSQLMPLPFVPPRIASEAASFRETCPLCGPIDGFVIRETDAFTWLAPAASWMPYQQWIVPKMHAADFTSMHEGQIRELATLLRAASQHMLAIGRSYNWMFLNFPAGSAAHWYVDLFPRLTTIAGFELATGTFVEIMDPAAAARRLR